MYIESSKINIANVLKIMTVSQELKIIEELRETDSNPSTLLAKHHEFSTN
jgi:hypothetical protein